MDKFWSKVKKTDGCWNWIASGRGYGYGAFKFQGRVQDAHRVSWIIHFGEIPLDKYVCHKCDNRSCVNPDHLFLGSQKDNIKDAISKGRFVFQTKTQFKKGRVPLNRKLTQEKVDEIRKKYVETKTTQRKLALENGVDRGLIYQILHNKIWKVN